MLKLKTALVAALLTTSTAAFAGSTVSFSANADVSFAASSAPIVRDHRINQAPYSMPQKATWSILSSSLQLRNGTDVISLQGRQTISKLRLQATSGNLKIDSVVVRYTDGKLQTVRVRQAISAENPMVQLDLPTSYCGIDSISIIGYGNRRASYQVLAQANRTEQPLPPRPVVNFTGSYTSVYGNVFLQQDGNRIHGTYPALNGTFDGYVSNGVATVQWSQPGGSGYVTFTPGTDGHVDGVWGNGTSNTGGGEWDLWVARR